MPRELLSSLAAHARAQPERIAVREVTDDGPGAALTWAQWATASAALAQRLRATLAEDEAVAIGLGNRGAFHIALMAALLADRDVLPLSPDVGRHEVRRMATEVRCGAVIGPPPFLNRVRKETQPRLTLEAGALDDESADMDAALGTCTGRASLLLNGLDLDAAPHLVRRTLDSLNRVAHNCAESIGLERDDLALLAVPVHHSYGLEHGLLAPLTAGCTVEIADAFNAELMRRRLVEAPVTVLPAVPFIFEALNYVFQRAEPATPPLALRRAYSAGAPLPREIFDAARKWLNVPLGQVYGTSEVGSLTFNDPQRAAFDPESVGMPMPGVRLCIIDPDAPRSSNMLPPGREGHVAVAMNDNDDASTLHLTGDLGRLDARGALTLTGRVKPLIDVGGLKVSPTEVETVLREHPAVRAACVTALPVTATARRVKAVVVPAAGASVTAEQVRQHVRERLSPHKVPRVIELRASLAGDAPPSHPHTHGETVRCR